MTYPERVVLFLAINAGDVVVDPEDEVNEALVLQRGLVSVLKTKSPFSNIRTRQTGDKIRDYKSAKQF